MNSRKHYAKSQTINKSSRIQRIPVNLLKQALRLKRIKNNGIGKNREKNRRKRRLKAKRNNKNFESNELKALTKASDTQLRRILENEPLFSDIPYDITPEELQGELALAQGGGFTVYIMRDGLSTLTIVLPQETPTIAQLKRAIEKQARVVMQRELRERYEERLKRRGINMNNSNERDSPHNNNKKQQVSSLRSTNEDNDNDDDYDDYDSNSNTVELNPIKGNSSNNNIELIQSTGELVCSIQHNGHQHRPNVSWRFLWRVYCLFNIATNLPINDKNGRKLLREECGIENAHYLKFIKREKYFGKKRQ